MQTFLTHPNFAISMMTLDNKRLGKQRVESHQIITAIQNVRHATAEWNKVDTTEWKELCEEAALHNDKRVGWANHPATIMWRNNVSALMLYADCAVHEWILRGFNNTMPPLTACGFGVLTTSKKNVVMPVWLGDEDFHISHRSNLLRKDPEHYSKFEWGVSNDIEYVWPK